MSPLVTKLTITSSFVANEPDDDNESTSIAHSLPVSFAPVISKTIKVVEKPGITMNPLLILGESGCGKSHILSASAQAMIRRQDGNVHLLSTSAMRGWESLPDGWQDAVSHANLIAIDDLHLADERIATELGMMIDYALNLGVQIIKEISVTVGGTTLCTIPGEFFLVNYNKNGYGKTGTLNVMTGNERKFYDPGKGGKSYPNAVYTTNSDGAEPSIRGEQLLIPLNLWWTVSYKQAFPLVSLQYNELYINVTLRPLKEWFIIRDVLDKTNNYPYTAPNFNRSEQQFYHFLQSPPNVELNLSLIHI